MNKRSIRKFTAMKSERQQAILDLLDQHHSVTVNEISNTLGVSNMTIRRDLAELADKDCSCAYTAAPNCRAPHVVRHSHA